MYESFYNFSEPPFQLTPDPRFYYSSSTHKRALTHLRFGFHQREGFVVITGKPGTGKTELMLHLLEGLPHDRITYGKIVNSNLDANEILQQVAEAFQISAEGVKKGVLLKKLEDVFLRHVRENKRLVLVVDEAHKLSINSLNELQMLTNFQLGGKAALQCILSGQDSLKLLLHNPDLLHLKQRVITSTFLMPLERHETQEYIEHRLRCVGWEGDPKFNHSAYNLIHETAEGIPRQINALCNRILLRAYAEQKHYIDEGMVHRTIEDARSEPLAANITYQQAWRETAGTETVRHASQQFSPSANNQATSDAVTADVTADNAVGEQRLYFYNDQDETLPLPSSLTHNPQSLNGNNAPSRGDSAGNASGEFDDEIASEARKLSDALSDFHFDTTLSTPEQKARQKLGQAAKSSAGLAYTANQSRANGHINLKSKSTRTWTAPLAYGSVALLLIFMGVFLWLSKFYSDVLKPMELSGTADDTFVAAIKGFLPKDNKTPLAEADVFGGQPKTDSAATLNAAPNVIDDALEQSGPDREQVVTSPAEAALPQDELPQATEADNPEGQWDSGALGGNFLVEQAEHDHEQSEKRLAANKLPLAVVNEEANATVPDVPAQAAHLKIPKNPNPVHSEVAVAGVDSGPKAAKPPVANSPKTSKSNVAKKSSNAKTKTINHALSTGQTATPTAKSTTKSTTTPATTPAIAAVGIPFAAAETSPAKSKAPLKAKSPHSTAAESTAKTSATKNSVANNSDTATGNTTDTLDTKKSTNPPKNVVFLNPGQVQSYEGDEPVSDDSSSDGINKAQLSDLLERLTVAYERGNLQQLLSVLSKDVRSNDGSTRRDLKNDYRKLFNITDMRKMTISGVNWSKKNRLIHGQGEFELHVREKGADSATAYGGIISLEVDKRAEGVVITRLNYDYKH